MPLVVKLKAIALNVGRRLTTDISGPRVDSDAGISASGYSTANPARRGTAPLTAVLPKVELGPPSSAQQRQFARQCTLQAVFDWYQGFLERETAEHQSRGEDYPKTESGLDTSPAVPGFPQFSRQLIETEPDLVRVRFFDAAGHEGGVLLLRSEAERCVIEVLGGPMYVARLTSSLPDLTREENASSTSTWEMASTEKQQPATNPSSPQDAG